MREVWAETFPDPDKALQKKREQRMKNAKLARESEEKEKNMTPEEIAEMEKNVPEWKRNALVASEAQVQEEKKGLFGRLSSSIKEKVSSTEAAKKFKESEEYQKLREARENYQEFKSNLQEGIENT